MSSEVVKARGKAVNRILGTLVVILVVLGVGVWGYVLGIYARQDLLTELHGVYNHIRIYEDGSYEGEFVGGTQTSGCIKGALCND